MVDLYKSLQDHGLRCEIRQKVRVQEIFDSLEIGQVLILPIVIDDQLTKHYLVVIREDLTTLTVVNPGIAVRRCSTAHDLFLALNKSDRIDGLLVIREAAPKPGSGMADRVSISNEKRAIDHVEHGSMSATSRVAYRILNRSEETSCVLGYKQAAGA